MGRKGMAVSKSAGADPFAEHVMKAISAAPLIPSVYVRRSQYHLPTASVYDIANSPTALILVNTKRTPSKSCHLRGLSREEKKRNFHPNPQRHIDVKDRSWPGHLDCLKTNSSHPGNFTPHINQPRIQIQSGRRARQRVSKATAPIVASVPMLESPEKKASLKNIESFYNKEKRVTSEEDYIRNLQKEIVDNDNYQGPSAIRRYTRYLKDHRSSQEKYLATRRSTRIFGDAVPDDEQADLPDNFFPPKV